MISIARAIALLLAGGLVVVCAAPASAQSTEEGRPEFALSLGYANLSLGSSSVIDSEGALRWEASLTFAPLRELPQLRVGGDVGVSLVLDDSTTTIISRNGNLIFIGSSQIPLWTIEPELRISWRQPIGDTLFIEPGVAGGFVFGFVDLHSEDFDDSYHADASTAFGRVFLRGGARVTGGYAGIEASYAVGGDLDFGGNASGDFSEFYIGVFGSLSF
jgi:hypothetical protein